MRNDKKKVINVVLIIAGITIFALALLMLNRSFNGVVKEWFYKNFIIEPWYQPLDKLGVLYKSWYEIKQFLIVILSTFIVVLVLCTSITAYLYGRYRSNKDISIFTSSINSLFYSDIDELMLPKKYSEIERQLMRIKAMSQRNQQLVQTEMQRKNDLITYLAHDLKTPLASIIGYLSLLDEAPDMPIEQKTKYSRIALEKAYRLEELINEFFDITRFNLQSIVLNKGKIKLEFMLHQLVDEFYPLLEPQGKQVVIHVPEDLILVGDADKLARVFNNILKNAIAYSYENSIIDISAVQNGDSITITFRNQGETIPSHKLDTIFDKFYRLDTARSTNTGGAGLGLAIAKEIVIAHDGTITVESNIENTTFTIVIPS